MGLDPPPATPSKQMCNPRPFVVTPNGRFLFVIHARSLEQARTLVVARLAGYDRHSHRRAAQGFAAMIPATIHNMPSMACSAMQKAIRRGMEKQAMEFACELLHTSRAFHTMVCNRLETICHEDRKSHAEKRPEAVALARRLRRKRPKGGQRTYAEIADAGHANMYGRPFSPSSRVCWIEFSAPALVKANCRACCQQSFRGSEHQSHFVS